MTPAAKVTYLVALLVGISIGGWLGFHETTVLLKVFSDINRVTGPTALGDFSYTQYKCADSEHARTALLTFAGFMEELEHINPEKTQKLQLALAYGRLALLADKLHDAEQSHKFMTRAQSWKEASGDRALSDSEMIAWVNQVDAKLARVQ